MQQKSLKNLRRKTERCRRCIWWQGFEQVHVILTNNCNESNKQINEAMETSKTLPNQTQTNLTMETINNAAKAVSETAQQAVGAGKQEKGEQQVKNDDTLSGKAQGAKDYVSGAAEKQGHGAKSDANNPLK